MTDREIADVCRLAVTAPSAAAVGPFDAQPKAWACLRRAEALPANRRERLYQKALQGWLDGDALARAASRSRFE